MPISGLSEKVLEKLQELKAEESPDFPGFFEKIFRLQMDEKARLKEQINLPPNSLETLEGGRPLFSFQDLHSQWQAVERFWAQVLPLVENALGGQGRVQGLVRMASERALLLQAVKAWYEGASLAPFAEACEIAQELLHLVIRASCYPFLVACAERAREALPLEKWRRGYCPVCGGHPDLAFLDREDGARWLVCSRCEAQWPFQRLQCPFCNSQDQSKLSYLTDESGIYRLYLCDNCRRYLKAVDLRCTQEEVLLPLERVLTIDLDRQGQQAGYTPGAP